MPPDQIQTQFAFLPPEQIETHFATRVISNAFACSPLEEKHRSPPGQILSSPHHQSKYKQFAFSPPEKIVCLLATRANTYTVHQLATRANTYTDGLLATRANAQFPYSPPGQIESSPCSHWRKYTVHLLLIRTNRFTVQIFAAYANIFTGLLLATRSNIYLPIHGFWNRDNGHICLKTVVLLLIRFAELSQIQCDLWNVFAWVTRENSYVLIAGLTGAYSHYEVTTCMNTFFLCASLLVYGYE